VVMKKILMMLFIALLPLLVLVFVMHKPEWGLTWLALVALGCIVWMGKSKGVPLAIFFTASGVFLIFSFATGGMTGAALGFIVYLFLVSSLLFLASELILVSQGGNRWDCFRYMLSFVTGGLFLGSYIIVEDGQQSTVKSKGALAGFKVANLVVIHNEQAAVFEQTGKFTRVEGPGVVFTKPFESIRKVIVTRTRFKKGTVDNALTKDGIPVTIHYSVLFRIMQDPAKQWNPEKPYPFSREAVLKATYNSFDWEIATTEVAKNLLRDEVGKRYMDDIFDPLRPDTFPQGDIKQRVRDSLRNIAEGWGAAIIGVQILGIEVPREIGEGMQKKWQVDWEARMAESRKQALITEGEAQAEVYNLIEVARAQAQTRMIIAITEGFRRMETVNIPIPQFIALRFIDALEKMASDPATMILLPSDVMATLQSIRSAIALPPGSS